MTQAHPLLERDVLFFGGKGGVGKTTLAAAFSFLASERGHRTLLVSTDPAHSTSDLFQMELGSDPSPVRANLWALEIDPACEADRYIADVKERIAESTAPRLLAEVERQIDIARVSPGAEEAALFDRFARLMEGLGHAYDQIIFDTAPTGQTLRLLSLPEQMAAWISGLIARRRKVTVLGRMWRTVAGSAAGEAVEGDRVLSALEQRKARFEHARTLITDQQRTAFVFVLIPERLPVAETRMAVATLAKYGIPIGAIAVNQVMPPHAEGQFGARRRAAQRECLAQIDKEFAAYSRFRVPLLNRDVVGAEALTELAGYVREEGPQE